MMYDTICTRLANDMAGGVDLLEDIPAYLSGAFEKHDAKSGELLGVSGTLSGRVGGAGGLRVWIDRGGMSITKGSMCKWWLGDNFQTMRRKDTEEAIQALSDTLHVPMGEAKVTRIDVGATMIMKHPPEVYLSHLGELSRTKRNPIGRGEGLYYIQNEMKLCLYDKAKEHRKSGGVIPMIHQGQNALRYEIRFLRNISRKLNVPEVTCSMLYNEDFYMDIVGRWRDNYMAIDKVNEQTINFGMIRTLKELKNRALFDFIQSSGGEANFIEQIADAQKKGILTPKQACDQRKEVRKVCQMKGGIIVESEEIEELNKRIKSTARYFR